MDFRTGKAVTPTELSLAIGFLFAAAHAVAVSVCLRFVRNLSPIILHLVCAVAIGTTLPVFLSVFAVQSQVATPFWPAASIFYGGVIAWLYAFAAVYKSISLGILQSLRVAHDGKLPIESIARDFALPRFAERVDILVAGGLAVQNESGYTITPEGLKQVRRLQSIQRIFAVSGKGFYLTS
jgi:predicted transcriptional regulator